MTRNPDVHLGIRSPRADKLVRMELVRVDTDDGSLLVKVVPCDADGRTCPDDFPSPELVRLESSSDIRAFNRLPGNGPKVCWLRCAAAAEHG